VTREQIVAQLHDIHAPPLSDAPPSLDLAVWPFVVYLAVCAAALALRTWRRNAWRRPARQMLRKIESIPSLGERWVALQDLAVGVARRRGGRTALPDIIFRSPDGIGDDDARVLAAHIRTDIAR
jgi:hypothetical protein